MHFLLKRVFGASSPGPGGNSQSPVSRPWTQNQSLTPDKPGFSAMTLTLTPHLPSPLLRLVLFSPTERGGGNKDTTLHPHSLALITQSSQEPVKTSKGGFPNSPEMQRTKCSRTKCSQKKKKKKKKNLKIMQSCNSNPNQSPTSTKTTRCRRPPGPLPEAPPVAPLGGLSLELSLELQPQSPAHLLLDEQR